MEEVVDLTVEDSPSIRIELAGPPCPLPRARSSSRSKMFYNPATKPLKTFRKAVAEAVPQTTLGLMYPQGELVVVTVICYLRRPNKDFRNEDRGWGRLKSSLPFARPTVPDIDNLAKFVLDGMNKLVYQDDRQVVKLVTYKLMDNTGDCEGRTVILVSKFNPAIDVPVGA